MKDPAKRQDGKEALRLVDREVRNLQDEVRRCELNLHHSHTGACGSWVGIYRLGRVRWLGGLGGWTPSHID